jgi:aryl-alcohol dehydrogenase-like predicted oxidoreductase
MAQLALAWVLHNEHVSSAIIGASRPEQVRSNVKAVDVTLDASVVARIEQAVGSLAVFDPAKTRSPEARVA